ncbi:MAG TPA: hypothetical protein PK360_00955, partial [bacterium]|nr:hypothetical protein [bacterium]
SRRIQERVLERLVAKGILSPQAAALIGQDLVDFLHGHRSLSIQDARVAVIGTGACSPRLPDSPF